MLNIDQIPFNEFDPTHKFCCAWVATAIIGGSAISALSQGYFGSKAASAQKQAADQARGFATNVYNQSKGATAPYEQAGADTTAELQQRLPFLTSPITMDQATLEQTPGYQFTRTQGLKAVQNSAAARGLGSSGAALKGAATFATGLADNTYKTQFDIENTNRTNAYSRLMGLIQVGQGAVGQRISAGNAATQNVNSATIQGGNAQAAGLNTIGTALGNVGNAVSGYGLYKGLYGSKSNNNGGASGGYADPSGMS